jgi:predicted DsbA family dithiol-disulfide isomerase
MKQEHGVDIVAGPFGIKSRSALVLQKWAETLGKGDEFHLASFESYWTKGESIQDRAILKIIATQVGLDETQIDDALENPSLNQAVIDDIQQARDYGLDGVPALVFNNKYLVMGAQPYETLVNAVKQAAQHEAY